MNRSTLAVLAIATTALTVAALVTAGPLTPPAGPVAPTYKTLSEVEPRIAVGPATTPGTATAMFRISQPGSYYLTANITGSSGMHGIQIASSGVTLDLSGFELRGVAGSLDGINVSAARGRNITISNGSLRSWGDCGLEAEFNNGQPPIVNLVNVDASLNTRDGISVWSESRIHGCSASDNGASGIAAVANALIVDCRSSTNGANGFVGNRGSTIIDSIASNNTGRGFQTASGSLLRGCVADNNGTGFVSQGSTFESCVAHDNAAAGFDLFSGCTVIAANAYRNGTTGIEASANSTVKDSTATENTISGISASTGTIVTNCTANANDLTGIALASGAQAINCSVVNNLGVGIQASSNTTVRGNTVVNNGGAVAANPNIRISGSDNRVEGNNVADGPIGFEVLSAGNIIIANTASGNTLNWSVVAGNVCLVILATNTAAAISGDSGGSSPGSTNPSVNYTY